jgi:quercetin dioxygenase-like cupin family protein
MMKQTPHQFGKLSGIIFDFEYANDVLPMHNHTEADVHITIVSKGSFRAHGAGWEMILKAGQIVDWDAGQAHELIALEPDSRFVNIVKGS